MKTTLVLVLFLNSTQPVVDHVPMQDKQSCQLAGELIIKSYVEAINKRWDPGTSFLDSYYVCVNN